MRYVGALTIIFSVLVAWRGYCAYLLRQLTDTRAFLCAVEDYREKVKCYLLSPMDWAGKYRDDRLSECGFLSRVAEGEDILSAYRFARGGCYLPAKVDSALELCFSDFGAGNLDTEIEKLNAALSRLRSEEKDMSDNIASRGKVAGALLGACAVGVVILVM